MAIHPHLKAFTDTLSPPNVPASSARAYLRHIASAPNIPRRSLHGERTLAPVAKKSISSLKDDRHRPCSPQPPMPPSWLETVARAVLGFPGARLGGPSHPGSHSPTQLPPGHSRLGHSSQRSSRSNTIRRHGRSNRRRAASPLENTVARLRGRSTPSLPTSFDLLPPPAILAKRSQVSPGQVVRLNVVCRSAPASRSSSVVGRKTGPDSASLGNLSSGSVRGKGKASQSARRKYRHKNHGPLPASGPYLRCRIEDDFTPMDWDNFNSSSSEDEDDGEVDLSKLLVHPRRQQSIESLRRHLGRPSRMRNGDHTSSNAAGTWTLHGDDGLVTITDGRRRIRRGSVNDGDWGLLVHPGPRGDDRSFRRRRGIPVSWTQQSGHTSR
ncbi:hypothetical protein F5148DRAFT_27091 [Russula earlei]|uniref:Uncharacterized protein n=1 Tax=Russula earlei TaxID=71964 RepID=A0ACC0UA67_9AGAM|nr:hypothetical protein F5148DRAFT_27091 [Russula earlei]